jgi:septal ring factor EnvC (AmiA/AmiB activator)
MSIMALSLLATGCTDLKPLQAQVDDLKTQVARLRTDATGTKTAADAAANDARTASQAAAAAQTAANQALAAAQTSQTCCDTTNEKVDRMFKRSVSK